MCDKSESFHLAPCSGTVRIRIVTDDHL